MTLAIAGMVLAARLFAQPVATSPSVITGPGDFWTLSDEEKQQVHRVRLELTVYYYDPGWNLLWVHTGGGGAFLPMQAGVPLPLKSGQRVLIEGTVIPAKGFSGREVKVTVLADQAFPKARPIRGNLGHLDRLEAEWVSLEGYVFRQLESDMSHAQYSILGEGQRISMRLLVGETDPIPQLQGRRIRCNGVFVGTRDPAGRLLRIDVWVPHHDEIEVLGRMEDDVRFELPRTPINGIGALVGRPDYVHVAGEVSEQVPGESLTLRDETGQLTVRSAQPDIIPVGKKVDVVGRPVGRDPDCTLEDPLFRPGQAELTGEHAPATPDAPLQKLRLAAQVLELDPKNASSGYPVALTGVVTWADPRARFFFLQDSSGGVRVQLGSPNQPAPAIGATVVITGATTLGAFSPEVILHQANEHFLMVEAAARSVTLEQAMTGVEEARWVEMRGYLRAIGEEGPWTRLDLTTAYGEFTALLPPQINVAGLMGSLVRISGVCTAGTNAQRELTGINLWVPNRDAIEVEEPRPADPFVTPLSTVASLRQFKAWPAVNPRVRVAGTVLVQVPGRYLFLQEGETGVLVLSRDLQPIPPGTAVEVVGFPGREGGRLVLREAVWRRAPTGLPAPVPLALADPAQLMAEADGRLVRVRATLLESITLERSTRLTLRAHGQFFEGRLETAALPAPPEPGSELEVTGVYRLESDEYHRPRSFAVQLRDAEDVRVLAAPPWWTAARAGRVVAALGLCFLLGIGWVTVLRRRVRQQTEQIRHQLDKEARLQAELERSSRLDSLGVLAGGIAHDFNNLLTAIMGNLGLMRLDEGAMQQVGELVDNAERASKRASEITQQLLTFAKGGDPVRSAVDLAEVVQEAADFVRHGSNVKVVFEIEPGLPHANVDAGQISRVVHNLVLNAMQAMPEGGLVRLALCARNLQAAELPPLSAGRYLQLTLADNGPGIAPEQLPRIFDPYFSTKVKGSGLGLATAHSIVKKHEGHIEVESALGRGTTFRLWLPVADCPLAGKPVEAGSVQVRAHAKVLFMDDEDAVCRVARAILQHAGHNVTVVHDGAAAVEAFREARDADRPYDLVILDLTVPGGMGGREAVAELRQIDPAVRVIASSGYSQDPVMASHRAFGFTAVLPKPYDPDSFIRVINQVRHQPG
jgi:signal transduction histidine kinase/CheY-like chemotaxis protein